MEPRLPWFLSAVPPPELITLASIPSDITEVTLDPSAPPALTIERLRAFLASATPLDRADPSRTQWHYAPWYSGSFVAGGQRYELQLFRGGRGLLHLADGTFGQFDFDPRA